MDGFREAHMRAFVYSSCDVYYNKMRAHALYGIQSMKECNKWQHWQRVTALPIRVRSKTLLECINVSFSIFIVY